MDVEIERDKHFREAFYQMDTMRKSDFLCDVILVTKSMEIRAHKIVLASSSNFFNNHFIKMGEKSRLHLENIEGKALLTLINYIYTFKIENEINQTNVQDLLVGANILQLESIEKKCYKYLEDNLNINTSFKILPIIAQDDKYIDLLKRAETFIYTNFNEAVNTKEFLDLQIDQVTSLISRDALVVPSEEKIFEGIISWLKHDVTNRKKYLSNLMSHVQFTLIPRDYLSKHVITEPLIQTDLKCKDLIINALLSKYISRTPSIPEVIKHKPRKQGEPRQIMLIMGGYTKEAKETFEYYDFKTNNWSQIYSLPEEKVNCSLATVNEKIYVVSENDIAEYDVDNNSWHNSTQMSLWSCRRGIGVLNDCIYIVVGSCIRNNWTVENIIKKFDSNNQKWSSIAPLSSARFAIALGVFNGFLYAVGGSTNTTFSPLKKVEYYDHNFNVWKRGPNLIFARFGASVGVLRNKLYVIGGRDGRKYLKSVECYSPDMDKFTLSAPLNIPRSDSAVVEFQNKLYVIGGHDGRGVLNTAEVYCPEKDQWELLPTAMNVARNMHGAVVVEKIFPCC